MPDPGDIVAVNFPGVSSIKRRPAVVVSTNVYHRHRPDLIVGILTSQVAAATAPTDYMLLDWSAAGSHRPSAFRAFLATVPAAGTRPIGTCSARDWQAIQARLSVAMAIAARPV